MELSADDKKELKLAFDLFDTSKSGTSVPSFPSPAQFRNPLTFSATTQA